MRKREEFNLNQVDLTGPNLERGTIAQNTDVDINLEKKNYVIYISRNNFFSLLLFYATVETFFDFLEIFLFCAIPIFCAPPHRLSLALLNPVPRILR